MQRGMVIVTACLMACGENFVDQNNLACSLAAVQSEGLLTAHLLQADPDGAFDYDPGLIGISRIDGSFSVENSSFKWKAYDEQGSIVVDVEGQGSVLTNGNEDLEMTATFNTRQRQGTYTIRHRREGCEADTFYSDPAGARSSEIHAGTYSSDGTYTGTIQIELGAGYAAELSVTRNRDGSFVEEGGFRVPANLVSNDFNAGDFEQYDINTLDEDNVYTVATDYVYPSRLESDVRVFNPDLSVEVATTYDFLDGDVYLFDYQYDALGMGSGTFSWLVEDSQVLTCPITVSAGVCRALCEGVDPLPC